MISNALAQSKVNKQSVPSFFGVRVIDKTACHKEGISDTSITLEAELRRPNIFVDIECGFRILSSKD